jgi:hypothetical protein
MRNLLSTVRPPAPGDSSGANSPRLRRRWRKSRNLVNVNELSLPARTLSVSVALVLVSTFSASLTTALAGTTIDSANKYSYGANIGWLDAYADGANGSVIGEYVCSGYLYAANVGWINLGSGTPANGIHYQNNSAADFGVNQDGLGNLRGYAYGANIGWVNFENTGAPRVDLLTGKLSGYAYSANCGWISLSNAFAYVRTAFIQPGADTDGDGIADAWELTHTNSLTPFTATSDTDGDGVSDKSEYLADTDPLDPNDYLRITAYAAAFGGGNETNTLTWKSRATREYRLSYRIDLSDSTPWVNATAVFAPDSGLETTRQLAISPSLTDRFFRVEAIRPLAP